MVGDWSWLYSTYMSDKLLQPLTQTYYTCESTRLNWVRLHFQSELIQHMTWVSMSRLNIWLKLLIHEWIDSTHDSFSFDIVWFDSTHDSFSFHIVWFDSTHDSKKNDWFLSRFMIRLWVVYNPGGMRMTCWQTGQLAGWTSGSERMLMIERVWSGQ